MFYNSTLDRGYISLSPPCLSYCVSHPLVSLMGFIFCLFMLPLSLSLFVTSLSLSISLLHFSSTFLTPSPSVHLSPLPLYHTHLSLSPSLEMQMSWNLCVALRGFFDFDTSLTTVSVSLSLHRPHMRHGDDGEREKRSAVDWLCGFPNLCSVSLRVRVTHFLLPRSWITC